MIVHCSISQLYFLIKVSMLLIFFCEYVELSVTLFNNFLSRRYLCYESEKVLVAKKKLLLVVSTGILNPWR